MPGSDEREPADVEIDDGTEVIVKAKPSGHGARARFHKPLSSRDDVPTCEVRKQYDGTWQRKVRRVLGDQRTPCKSCYGRVEGAGVSKTKPCPLCGETVTSTAYHLRNDCEENQ